MINVEALRDEIRLNHLSDTDKDVWSDVEIENSIFAAEVFHRTYKPSCTATYAAFTCAAGSRQTLGGLSSPSAASLLDVDRNGDASTIGDAIVRTSREELDRFDPAWQQATQASAAREFTISEVEPLVFYLNPPVTVNTSIMLTFSAIPDAYGTVDSNTVTTVTSDYRESIKQYALFILFSKYKEGTVNYQRGQLALQLTFQLLGIDMQMRKQESPTNNEMDK